MNNSRLVLVNVIVLVLLIAGGAVAIYYYNQSVNYISSDNASVYGQQVPIASPAAGQLTDWTGDVGKTYAPGDRVGTVTTPAGSVAITVPTGGTIVQQSAAVGMFVAPGTPLARAYDLNRLSVIANITETVISDVKAGQAVDVYIEAFPGTTLTGRVDRIGLATAGTFSLLPPANTSGNYTRVAQVIPVTIGLDGYRGLGLVPGLSASVRIHR